MACPHTYLTFLPSSHADVAGYKAPTPSAIASALSPTGRSNKSLVLPSGISTYPLPLILPVDDLAVDPKYPKQTFKGWRDDKDRNKVSPTQKTIYVVPPPKIGKDLKFMNDWLVPSCAVRTLPGGKREERPETMDVVEYLQAFYHGMEVKLHPSSLSFALWDSPSSSQSKSKRSKSKSSPSIAVHTNGEAIQIRTRPVPDNIFSYQLNLSDMLDVLLTVLPNLKDAYAILLLTEHDLYEDEEDTFCCGRAFGASRISIVSMARYDPYLDPRQGIEREHEWPASHCVAFMEAACREDEPKNKKRKENGEVPPNGAIHCPHPPLVPATTATTSTLNHNSKLLLRLALAAHSPSTSSSPETKPDTEGAKALWTFRLSQTSSHELGHCLGIDHCVFFACGMQGSASLKEDARQPPYLCPVDLKKLQHAVVTEAEWGKDLKEWEREREERILQVCRKWKGKGGKWDALAGWTKGRLDAWALVQLQAETTPS